MPHPILWERGHLSSPDDDLLTHGISRKSTQAMPPSIVEDQRDRFSQALTRLRLGLSLPVGTRDLGAIRDEPLAVIAR